MDCQIETSKEEYHKWINDNINLSSGVYLQYQRNHNFKTVEDLLGGEFWLDVDRFASQIGVDPEIAQNDINNPNKKEKISFFILIIFIFLTQKPLWIV